ncbi:MAG: hypothetical protein IJ730_06245 [Alphaproteobacteria bacterium]|nr:hypothetical protein [Alphaproteobacteria bacterium]
MIINNKLICIGLSVFCYVFFATNSTYARSSNYSSDYEVNSKLKTDIETNKNLENSSYKRKRIYDLGVANYDKSTPKMTEKQLMELKQQIGTLSADQRMSSDTIKINFTNYKRVMDNLSYTSKTTKETVYPLKYVRNLDMSNSKVDSRVKNYVNSEGRGIDAKKITLILEQCDPDTLESINISGNNLTEIPAEVFKFKKLRWLKADHNKITDLPPEISELTELRILKLDHNNLTRLPDEVQDLPHLLQLHLESNDFDQGKVPDLKQFKNLKYSRIGRSNTQEKEKMNQIRNQVRAEKKALAAEKDYEFDDKE